MKAISNYGQQYIPEPTYSLHNLLRFMADPTSKVGGYEREVSEELTRTAGRKPEGLFVPMKALARALTVSTAGGSTGGQTVATHLRANDMVELLRNRSVVINAGATVLTGLNGNVAIPRATNSSTAYWVAESGSPTESQPAFDQVPMSPKTVAAYTDISRKMILQSSLDISGFVASDLAATIGLAIDAAALTGTGSNNQPTGVFNQANVQTLSLGGSAPTWGDIVTMETMVAQENTDESAMAYAITPQLAGKLRGTFMNATYGAKPILEGPRADQRMNGRPTHVSNQLPHASASTQHMIFGNWADLVVGQWGMLDLVIDPYTLGTSGGLRLVAMQDVDICVRHPKSFVVVTDAGV